MAKIQRVLDVRAVELIRARARALRQDNSFTAAAWEVALYDFIHNYGEVPIIKPKGRPAGHVTFRWPNTGALPAHYTNYPSPSRATGRLPRKVTARLNTVSTKSMKGTT